MNVSELTLPDLDITNPAFAENPFPQYREAIKQHWLASTAVGYVVLGFNDMKNLLLMDDKLDTPNKAITTLMGADDSIWGKWNNRFMLAISGDDHKRIRDLVAPTFTPRNAELHRPIMKETVNGLLDDWAARNRFDFAEFASFFPISVMCRLIGAPVDAVPEIKDKLEVMGAGFSLNPHILPDLDDAIEYMLNFVEKLFKERKANPPEDARDKDLLDQLLEVTDREDGLTRQDRQPGVQRARLRKPAPTRRLRAAPRHPGRPVYRPCVPCPGSIAQFNDVLDEDNDTLPWIQRADVEIRGYTRIPAKRPSRIADSRKRGLRASPTIWHSKPLSSALSRKS